MKKLLFLTLLCISSLVKAEWTLISKNDSGDLFFLDFNTIQRNGKLVRVWEKTEYSNNEGGSKSARIYREYDCEEKKVRFLSLQAFTGANLTGENLSPANSKPSDWIFIPPNTPFAFNMSVACKKK